MRIVGIFGARGSGKSEAAKAACSLGGWFRLSFAQPIRDMLSAIGVPEARKHDKEPCLMGKTYRELITTLGSEWGRDMVHKSIWTTLMKEKILHLDRRGAKGIVVDDVRFDNERKMLIKMGASIARVVRLNHSVEGDHQSEHDWKLWSPDVVLLNDFHDNIDGWWKYTKKKINKL